MSVQIQSRHDTAANWTANNPVLSQGEIGFETDSNPLKMKVGDGSTVWNSLPYEASSLVFTDITSGTNTTATMTVGSGGDLTFSGTGIVNASKIAGTPVSGAASSAGQILIYDGSDYVPGDPFVQGVYNPGTNTLTGGISSGPIKPVLVGGSDYAGTPLLQNLKVNTTGQIEVGNSVTVAQGTASNLLAEVSNNGTFVVQATLANETTKVIGTVRNLGNAGAIYDAATAASVPANAIQIGNRAATAYPTAVTDGQLVAPMSDKAGRQVVAPFVPRDLLGTASVQTTDASSHTLIGAGGAGVFNDILCLCVTNESNVSTVLSLGDGTVTYKFAIPPLGGGPININSSLPATSTATAWSVQSSATVTLDFVVTYGMNK